MTNEPQNQGTLTVHGEGQVKAKPDLVRVSLSVITEAKTAVEAVQQNGAQTETVLARVRALGVPDGGLRTAGVGVYPIIQYQADTSRIVGYRAEDTVQVEAAVELAGKIFDEGVAAGANQGSSLTFALRDEAPFRRQALEAAVAAARKDGDAVAHALGAAITGTGAVEIESGGGPIVVRAVGAADRAATPVLPGDLTISAQVRVVYNYSPRRA